MREAVHEAVKTAAIILDLTFVTSLKRGANETRMLTQLGELLRFV